MAKKRTQRKLKTWLKAYLDEGTDTFLNAAASARKANYAAKNPDSFKVIGCQNLTKLNGEIAKWLDEHGFSDARLKTKLLQLVEAKKTVFQKLSGVVTSEELPEGHRVAVKTGRIICDAEGKELAGDGDCLIEIDVEALEIQRQTLDMALKVKGLYAPEKKEITGKDGQPIETRVISMMDAKALDDAIAGATKKSE